MTTLTKDELQFFDPIMEFVNYYGSQKEYLTKEKDSKGWLKTVNKFTDFINDYITKPSHPETLLQIKPLRAHYRKRMAKKDKKQRDWYFVTIAPPNDFPIKKLISMMKRIEKWSCWSEFIGVIEQRSHTNEFYGAHIHFLGKKSAKYAPSNVKQRISNIGEPPMVDCKIIDDNFAPDKQDYFFSKFGKNKKNIKKYLIMKIDTIFREKHKIPRFYGEKIIF